MVVLVLASVPAPAHRPVLLSLLVAFVLRRRRHHHHHHRHRHHHHQSANYYEEKYCPEDEEEPELEICELVRWHGFTRLTHPDPPVPRA